MWTAKVYAHAFAQQVSLRKRHDRLFRGCANRRRHYRPSILILIFLSPGIVEFMISCVVGIITEFCFSKSHIMAGVTIGEERSSVVKASMISRAFCCTSIWKKFQSSCLSMS